MSAAHYGHLPQSRHVFDYHNLRDWIRATKEHAANTKAMRKAERREMYVNAAICISIGLLFSGFLHVMVHG